MKRLVPIALLGLMLAACGRREAPAPPSTSTQAPTPTTRSAAAASTSASSLETVGESVNAQLRRQLRDGKADPTVIAQLFAIEVAPLPGVTPPAGRVEDKFEGTDAALRLQSVFLELTPEQRKVAAPYLGLAPFADAKRQLPPFNLKPFVPPAAATRALRTSPAFRPRPIEAGDARRSGGSWMSEGARQAGAVLEAQPRERGWRQAPRDARRLRGDFDA